MKTVTFTAQKFSCMPLTNDPVSPVSFHVLFVTLLLSGTFLASPKLHRTMSPL